METPIIELTELFVRGIGEATDVVSKEMFEAISGDNLKTLLGGGHIDKKKRLSLRPEGTAGIVRACVQHDLVPQGAPPAKLMYAGPMFRAENPQAGRQRQFNQIGIECLGSADPMIDAEAIIMLMRFFSKIGISENNTSLILNSLGCEECRPSYRQKVLDYLKANEDKLCDTCKTRMEQNPLRAFDCKNQACKDLMANAPKITESLCDECAQHFEDVCSYLDMAGVKYVIDSSLVRGLDYYTRTVFEVQVLSRDSAQNAIGGGGRYDGLVEEVGGRPTPGFGFALGYERCLLALQDDGFELPSVDACDAFVATVDGALKKEAFRFVQELRDINVAADMDHQDRSLKSQLKLANKLGASVVAILGPDEMEQGVVRLRDMRTHDEVLVPDNEVLAKVFDMVSRIN